MAEAATEGATPLLPGLPDDIVVWEILVLLPPICLLRCRAVSRSWRRVTSTRDFLLAHHDRQPSLPIVSGFCGRYQHILAFDNRAAEAHLQPVARLDDDETLHLEATCDGLFLLSMGEMKGGGFVCNPATRQRAPLSGMHDLRVITLLGMYLHRPTGEIKLLYRPRSNWECILGDLWPKDKVGCYIYTFGQPSRYIGGPEAVSVLGFDKPALVRDSLHWSPVQHQSENGLLLVFDTTAESFRQIRAPSVPANSHIFEMDGTLGIYSYNDAIQIVDIWVLQNYECEVWENKYRVVLPLAEIKGKFGTMEDPLDVTVASANGDVILLLCDPQWLFYVDTDGKLVESFHFDGHELVYDCQLRLKQTLVPHNFFTSLKGYAVNASPFM